MGGSSLIDSIAIYGPKFIAVKILAIDKTAVFCKHWLQFRSCVGKSRSVYSLHQWIRPASPLDCVK